MIDYTTTIEVNRVCVLSGNKNACSKLYSTCARIAKELGYKRIITYTLKTEPGTSLKACGWKAKAIVKFRQWTNRKPTTLQTDKIRWEKQL